MSETAQDKVNRILRDHEGYTGDGKGGVGALPIGDRSTRAKPISKRDLREAMTATLGDSYEARDIAVDAAERAEAAALGVEYPVSYAPGQGLNPTQQDDARDNLGLGTAATVDHGTDPGEVPLNSDLGSMAVEDADDYVTKASKATQEQAEGGVTGDVWMDDIRVRQAIEALSPVQQYTGSSRDQTVFPVGHIISVVSSKLVRNDTAIVRLRVGDDDNQYTTSGSGAVLSGVWRARGRVSIGSDTSSAIMQRVS